MPDSKLDTIIAELNKKFGPNTINRHQDTPVVEADYISTGSPFLNWCITGIDKGIPRGRIVEFFGLPSSGKSLICQTIVAESQKKGEDCVWIDAENAFDPEFAKKLGVDIDRLIISQSSIGEPTIDLVCKLLEGKPAIIVIDSVASMVPMDDMEKSLMDPTMATRARLMSRGVAKISALNHHTVVIFINQLRTDIGAFSSYGTPTITTGGRALGHYASVRVDVRRGEILEEDKKKIGQVVKFRIVKNKVGPPFKEGYFNFYYDGRIDVVDQIVSLALLENKVVPSGSWFNVGKQKFQGKEAFVAAVREDTKLFQEIVDSLKK